MAILDCRRCKRWKGCPGKQWWHFGEIRWCPLQIIWILQHAEELRAGQWPPQDEDSRESRQLRAEAYFVKAGIAISEVEKRLETTPGKGELLITQVEDGRTLGTLSHTAYRILMYVKGKNRKDMNFKSWQRQERYRKMNTLP